MPTALRVLVLEDRLADAELMCHALRQAGFDSEWWLVETEPDYLAHLSPALDLILADYSLPQFNALRAIQLLQERGLDIPFIVVTGTVGEELAVECMRQGAADYLLKDRLARLGQSVTRALQQKRLRQEKRQAEEALREGNRQLDEALVELRRTQGQIVQQERLRALGLMASGIAHDLNNALSPILAYSELLLSRPENLDDKEKVTRQLETINAATRDAMEVVRRLREVYRPRKEGELFLPVKMNQLFEQAILLTEPTSKDRAQERGINIYIKTDFQEIPLVDGYEPELREVLVNLILNAVDALTADGTITLRTRLDGEHVVLDVRDTGIGMTEEVWQHCQDPFFTTKGERGTGMGLAIAYGVIQRHGGSIDVESGPGKGTNVIVHLPISRREDPGGRRRKKESRTRPLHILVVDDEPLICSSLAEMLAEDGHTVETAANGRNGFEKFRAGSFDLVIADRAMPELNGDQLAAAIKCAAVDQPVILLTGFGDMMQDAGVKPEAVDLVISKPVTLISLRQALAKVTSK